MADVTPRDDLIETYFGLWEPHTYTDPDVAPLLRSLRERSIRVGVLSNTVWPRALHERAFRRDEVLDLIDGAVYSSEIPRTKPHPEAFRAAGLGAMLTAVLSAWRAPRLPLGLTLRSTQKV
jgi:putative hydrolase of the HAD superfamily